VIEDVVARWHEYMRGTLPGGLDELLTDDVVFYSPVDTAVLEFETTVDGKCVNGVDIIRCDERGRISAHCSRTTAH
jgi:hypothetical protein